MIIVWIEDEKGKDVKTRVGYLLVLGSERSSSGEN